MKVLILLIPFIIGFGPFESPQGIVDSGNERFEENKFDEAIELYDRASEVAKDKATVEFNKGNALLKKGDIEKALKSYEESAMEGNPEVKAKAYYNMGNAFYGEGKYEEAAQAFKHSLKYNASDADAKVNLEMALKMIKEEQQKEKNDKDEKKDGKSEKDSNSNNQKKEDSGSNEDDPENNGQNSKDGQNESQGDNANNKEGNREEDINKKDHSESMGGKDGEMSEEEAKRLLESLGDQNMDLQNLSNMLKGSVPAKVEKDW